MTSEQETTVETGKAMQTCGQCKYFIIDTCMNPKNKRDGIRLEVNADHSCGLFKLKEGGKSWKVVNGDWRYGKWRPEEKREIDPRLKTCGNCKRRKMGFCVGRVFSPAVIKDGKVVRAPGFIDVRESVDRDEPACTLFDPVPNSKLTHEAPLPVNARQLVRVVRCCGECVFFLNGICMNVKWQRELGLSDRPKVEYFAKACKMNKSVLEELK